MRERELQGLAISVLLHLALGGAIAWGLPEIEQDRTELVEIEILESEPENEIPAPEEEEVEEEKEEPEPPEEETEEPEPLEEVEEPPRDIEPPPRATQPPPDRQAEPIEPEEAAPGPNTDDSEPAPLPTYNLDPVMTGDGPGVVGGPPPATRRVGTGGTGTNTGGGGPPDSTGTGVAPRPVSIASLKRRARPIGDTDYFDARKDYPPAATREGIEGSLKVKLLVDETGKVVKRQIVGARLGHGLDQLALRLAARLRFDPAIDSEDRPVASTVVWTFDFRLPR